MSDAPASARPTPAAPEADAPRPPTWHVRPPAPPADVAHLVRTLGVPARLAAALWARGFGSDDALAALEPPLAPSPIPTLDAAAQRLRTALERGERILVHGDYDADGITGTAVLLRGLRALGGTVDGFLPNRLTHGYGVHADLVPEHAERSDLFVTVDCGITNVAEVAALRAADTDVIVTDHHTPRAELPAALIVHPRLAADGVTMRPGHPGVEPTGSGVAFHLLWRLHELLGLEPPLDAADVAMIGTVADVAPLLGENRALVRAGLQRLADSAWPGVRAMASQSRLPETPTARDVAFAVAPRLNAAGRLGEPEQGLALLLAPTERKARELATYLDARNEERRAIQDAMFDEAVARVDPRDPALVVGDDAWHPGVMGIVASKLLERYYKPVFIMARGQGSVRSTPGISAVDALEAAAPTLRRFGGHAAAAGFAVDPERVGAFREAIHAHVRAFPVPTPDVTVDALLAPDEVDEDLWRGVRTLEPFGEGHPAPTFALVGPATRVRAVGKEGRHLQLGVGGVKGVAWNRGDLAAELRPGGALQVAAQVRENHWNDRRTLEFVADALRPADPLPLADAPAGAPPPPDVPEVHRRPPEGDPVGTLHLTAVPHDPDGDPEGAHAALRDRLRGATRVWFDLDADAQAEALEVARSYPTVHDVRRTYVALRRGSAPTLGARARRRAEAVLREVGLLDERGRALRADAVDPHASATLVAGLVQRYRLETLIHAYRHLDDDGFARTVATLYLSDDA